MTPAELDFLIVEDQGFQRWHLEKTLRALGARRVESAADGRAALELLRAKPVDVVVTDLDMPGMDGMEFIRRLGEGSTPVSLIVASSLEPALIASVEAMAIAYGVPLLGAVDKPVTAEKLAALLDLRGPARVEAPPAAPFGLEEIEEGLRGGQVEAFFQPKVEIATGRVRGAEALARWRHPGKGIVLPRDFIPALERGPGIGRLTEAVLKRAVSACRAWQAAGLDLAVAVNVSLLAASDKALADWLMQLASFQGVEPRRIVIEVTETAEASNLGVALENLSRLRMRGFGLSIDDYGMGYSSMQQLTRIPFTELKIDQAFVRNAARRPADRAMLESSLEVAAKLGIHAVAEGIETQAEWDLLRDLGCHSAQGYYIAAPMPAGEFLAWVAARQA